MPGKLQTLFSPAVYPIVMALAVTVLALVLVSIMRRVVTLLLQRSAPHWIGRVTLLLQAAVLVGELAFIISFITPNWLVAFLASLLFALVAAALFLGKRISTRIASMCLDDLRYYRVGNWVTVARKQYRRVIAVWPLRTRLPTSPQGQVRLPNRSVAGAPILVHTDQQGTLPAMVNRVPVELSDSGVESGMQYTELAKQMPPHSVYIAPLVKRPALGKRSIKSLYR